MRRTYRADIALTRAASGLRKKQALSARPPCALAPFILMSDPRSPNIAEIARAMPPNSALIYRHFGHAKRHETAKELRQICFDRGAQLLIGQDTSLAIECGADGVHFAQKDMARSQIWRARLPNWILSAAAHDKDSIDKANLLPLDAITLSPLFKSSSPSANVPLGLTQFNSLCAKSVHPVIALGGINSSIAARLAGCHAAGIAGVSGLIIEA